MAQIELSPEALRTQAQSYTDGASTVRDVLSQFADLLDEIYQQLHSVANTLEETDAQITSQIGF